MALKRKLALLSLPLAVCLAVWSGATPRPVDRSALEECTIGAAIGAATADGRPMIWKKSDTKSHVAPESSDR